MSRWLIAALVGLFTGTTVAEEARPLRVGLSIGFEPVAFIVADELQGIEIDFARIVAARIDRPVEFKVFRLDDLLPALEDKKVDVVMSALSVEADRAQRVRFADPYMEIGQMAIVRTEDASTIGAPGGLVTPGLKVGVHIGSTGDNWVAENLPDAERITFDSVEEGLAQLRAGSLDAFVHDSITSWQLSRSFVNDELLSLNRFLTHEQVAWAVHRDARELQTTLNLILKDMKSSGELKAVLDRWLPVIPVNP